MTDLPCRVSRDELNHDIAQSRGLDPDEVDQRAAELADELLSNEEKIAELIDYCGADFTTECSIAVRWYHLFVETDRKHTETAILDTARRMHEHLRTIAIDKMREKAVRQLSEAKLSWYADDDRYQEE